MDFAAPTFVQQDPSLRSRYALAQALQQQGQQTGEVRTPIEGVARLAQALSGAFIQKGLDDKVEARKQAYSDTLSKAMQAGQPTQGWVNPDTGNQDIAPKPANFESLARVLATNPDTAPLGLQMQMGELQYRRGREDKKADTEDERKFTVQQTQAQQAFQAAQGELQRAHALHLQENSQASQQRLQEAQQAFQGAQNDLSRALTASEGAANRGNQLKVAQLKEVPDGYRQNPDGSLAAIPGGPADPKQKEALAKAARQAVQLPTSALNKALEERDAIGTANNMATDLASLRKQVESGAIPLGPMSNIANRAQNALGLSDEGSRNFASFKATLERMRNDSLRLNKGVQTEGDAVRAWNELFDNLNDPKVVSQRLAEIEGTNRRAVDLRKLNHDQIYTNFGAEPPDLSKITGQPATVGADKNKAPNAPPATSGPGANGGWGIARVQ